MPMLLFLQAAGSPAVPEPMLPDSGWTQYWQTLGALLLVLLLLVLAMRYVLPALPMARQGSYGLLRVRGSLSLDARKRVYLIEAGGKVLLIGCSESSINLLERFELEQFPATPSQKDAPSPFARILQGRGE